MIHLATSSSVSFSLLEFLSYLGEKRAILFLLSEIFKFKDFPFLSVRIFLPL